MNANAWKIWVSVTGIAPRQRKVKHHFVRLGTFSMMPDLGEAERMAKEAILKYRDVRRAVLKIDAVEIQRQDDGTVIETWSPFDDRNKQIAFA